MIEPGYIVLIVVLLVLAVAAALVCVRRVCVMDARPETQTSPVAPASVVRSSAAAKADAGDRLEMKAIRYTANAGGGEDPEDGGGSAGLLAAEAGGAAGGSYVPASAGSGGYNASAVGAVYLASAALSEEERDDGHGGSGSGSGSGKGAGAGSGSVPFRGPRGAGPSSSAAAYSGAAAGGHDEGGDRVVNVKAHADLSFRQSLGQGSGAESQGASSSALAAAAGHEDAGYSRANDREESTSRLALVGRAGQSGS